MKTKQFLLPVLLATVALFLKTPAYACEQFNGNWMCGKTPVTLDIEKQNGVYVLEASSTVAVPFYLDGASHTLTSSNGVPYTYVGVCESAQNLFSITYDVESVVIVQSYQLNPAGNIDLSITVQGKTSQIECVHP